ncbi:MAG TPA: hypothetical protein VGI97_14770 [Gemmatimonadaceae bacterium]
MKNFSRWCLLFGAAIAVTVMYGHHAVALQVHDIATQTMHHLPMLMGTTIGAGVYNIVDVVKGKNPDGSEAKVAEILNRTDEIMYDIPFIEGNLVTGDQITIRTGLPTPTWRRMNQGIAPTKSQKSQVVEACAELADISTIDVQVANLGGNPGAARLSEATAHIEGMNQAFIDTLFYGSAITPEKFVGLSARYSSLSAGNGQNIVDGGGVGVDNTSVWLIVWSPDTVYGIYPKGMVGGLQHKDLGEQLIAVTAGNPGTLLLSYVDQYMWDCGLAVKDWRFCVRVANIDVSNLVTQSTPANLAELLIMAISRIPSFDKGNAGIYMNRTVYEMFAVERRRDVISGGQLKFEVVDGKMIPFFMGIPIRKSDGIILTETQVS